MFRKLLSILAATGVVIAFSLLVRPATGLASGLPTGETTFGQTTVEPAYNDANGSLVYLSTPHNTQVNPNFAHNVAPIYLPMYPIGSTVGTLNCEDVPIENCPDHGPLVASLAEALMPTVYGGGVLGHDHLVGIASTGGDFNIDWEPVLLLFTNPAAANMHITTLRQVNWALQTGNAIPVPLQPATFHCSVVPASVYNRGTPLG